MKVGWTNGKTYELEIMHNRVNFRREDGEIDFIVMDFPEKLWNLAFLIYINESRIKKLN